MAHAYANLYKLPTTGLRFFTVYGPWGRPDMALFKFTKGILDGKPIPVYNCGEMVRDFTYIDDVVDAFSVATVNKIPAGIFNIGTGKSTSVLEVFRYAEGIVHNEDFLTKQLELQSQDNLSLVNFWAGTKITIERLGWEPKTPLQDGISKTWDYINHYDTT